jgi:hypothetical protein
VLFRRKLPWYPSDFIDFFRGRITQSLAATIFLFFANVTKIITFGGVMEHMLHDQMVNEIAGTRVTGMESFRQLLKTCCRVAYVVLSMHSSLGNQWPFCRQLDRRSYSKRFYTTFARNCVLYPRMSDHSPS